MTTNVFRSTYRALTEQEKVHIAAIKTSAEVMYNQLVDNAALANHRCMAIAKTKLEESVMWATKAITG